MPPTLLILSLDRVPMRRMTRMTWTHDRRPQQHADPLAADADIGKVQRGERTVCQHPVKRLAGRAVRPAGYPETDQSDAGEAAHSRISLRR